MKSKNIPGYISYLINIQSNKNINKDRFILESITANPALLY